ncbi:MAG: hypothetical protein JSU65_00345 [Candidatus Zixiibacteriota bacterium]|nr:MAG: hypothetical protein JSU65_00345 [candidate division Zixibacteria bacterium]
MRTRVAGDLLERLENMGWRAALVPVDRLRELRDELMGRHARGEFAPELWHERYSSFDFGVTTAATGARSILIVAASQPHVRLNVTLGRRRVPVLIPPTYSTRIDVEVESLLEEVLKPSGHSFFRRSLPLKLLAVHSGLARYGRNNLAYVDGMGSYCRLLGFCTRLKIDATPWAGPQPLAECETCVTCINKCPTKAILRHRFLIRAERCLTFHNEREGGFPPDLQPQVHHCLVGCLYCQAFCPVNQKVAGWIESAGTLNAEDTAVLLNGGPVDALSDAARQIMDEFGFTDGLPEVARNLKALLATSQYDKTVSRLLTENLNGGLNHVK